jgi:hypothetical protein
MTQTVGAQDTIETLARLRALLAREGEAIAPVLGAAPAREVIGPLVAACAAGRPEAAELALVLESILEGYLLHYGRTRLLETDDEDLRLLAGDHLYALGLSRLARLGDLDAVRALADLITLCARAHADAGANGAPPPGERPAALWLLTALAVGGGRWPGYEDALETARADPVSRRELLAEAVRRAAQLNVELEAQAALIAFDRAVADRPHA